jgi:hypothetical protein
LIEIAGKYKRKNIKFTTFCFLMTNKMRPELHLFAENQNAKTTTLKTDISTLLAYCNLSFLKNKSKIQLRYVANKALSFVAVELAP